LCRINTTLCRFYCFGRQLSANFSDDIKLSSLNALITKELEGKTKGTKEGKKRLVD